MEIQEKEIILAFQHLLIACLTMSLLNKIKFAQ